MVQKVLLIHHPSSLNRMTKPTMNIPSFIVLVLLSTPINARHRQIICTSPHAFSRAVNSFSLTMSSVQISSKQCVPSRYLLRSASASPVPPPSPAAFPVPPSAPASFCCCCCCCCCCCRCCCFVRERFALVKRFDEDEEEEEEEEARAYLCTR